MLPRVSVIVPARNEAATIEACVRSILEQRVEGGLEVVVADGASTDDTAALARAAGATVVENPSRTTPAALNAALAAARGEVIVRFDAHGRMPPRYVEASVRALDEEPGAVGVGGWILVDPAGPWGRAVGDVLASRFGIGNARSWRRPRDGAGRSDVDTFPLGCWPADALRAVGGWDERFLRNQDYELNYRLRRTGGRLVFDPGVWSYYRPRESWSAVARQYWDYGRFKALTVATAPRSLRPRQTAPVALLAGAALSTLPVRPARAARVGVAAYALLLGGLSVGRRRTWRTAAVFATVHGVWGAGLVAGLAQIGGRAASTRARAALRTFGARPEDN